MHFASLTPMPTADDRLLITPGPIEAGPSAVVEKQSTLNRSTRGQWHLYASHRQELERLLVPAAPGGRVCVLGAGNCNDLDLQWLTTVYREVHLVDIDPDALQRGVKFQKVSDSKRLTLHRPIDLTNLAEQISGWQKIRPAQAEVKAAIDLIAQRPATFSADHQRSFDVVLSPCVLSQLLMPVRDALGEDHPAFMPLLTAMRAAHLKMMLDLLAPGGRGVFACDILSSKTFPELARVTNDRLPDLMGTMLASGKCFSGLEPASVIAALTRANADNVRLIPPWSWHLGLSKSFLVYAVTFGGRNR